MYGISREFNFDRDINQLRHEQNQKALSFLRKRKGQYS
jgi:uncharacterized protein YlaN (UPF0358 family)